MNDHASMFVGYGDGIIFTVEPPFSNGQSATDRNEKVRDREQSSHSEAEDKEGGFMDSLYDMEGDVEEGLGHIRSRLRETLERLIKKKIEYYL